LHAWHLQLGDLSSCFDCVLGAFPDSYIVVPPAEVSWVLQLEAWQLALGDVCFVVDEVLGAFPDSYIVVPPAEVSWVL
jgi:hypothetical protein